MLYKHKVMRLNSGNLRANMMIYKELGAKEDAPYVGLETQGPVGCYNRANRSLFHFNDARQPRNEVESSFQSFGAPCGALLLVLIFRLMRFAHSEAAIATTMILFWPSSERQPFSGEQFGLCHQCRPCWHCFPVPCFGLDRPVFIGTNHAPGGPLD